jgi:hypothetical protein
VPGALPAVLAVRRARHNDLRDIDVDVPLWRPVAVADVSGSGKTSLAKGNVPIVVMVIVLSPRHVPESRDPGAGGKTDYPGAAAVVVFLSGISFAFIEAPRSAGRHPLYSPWRCSV